VTRLLVPLALLALVLAGCASPQPPAPPAPGTAPEQGLAALTFEPTVRVDDQRIASEPSVKLARDGTIFVAAPTGVIKYATRPQDALNQADKGIFQGAIWRSTDGGKTFEFRAGLGAELVPYHTAQPGGGDSDIAIDGAGRVYVADQFGLFTESVQFSDDNGDTWTAGTTTGSGHPPVDRQWMWPDPGQPGHVWMVYDGFSGMMVSETTDGGATWTATQVSDTSASPGPLVAIPGLVAFTMFNGGAIIFVSTHDGGMTWEEQEVGKGRGELNDFFPATVADTSGTVYVAWMELDGNDSRVQYTYSKDLGATWSPNQVAFRQPGLGTFLWVAAGAPGRLGLSWYGAPDPEQEWYEETGILIGADTPAPKATQARVSQEPARVGPPCQSGSTCTSGRELGDFQQCAVTPDGRLVVSYVTVLSAEEGGRITFAQQSAGPELLDATPEPWVV
jgi:hypothetical protein